MENELIIPFNIDKPVVYTALSELMINALNETFFAQCEEVEIYQLDGKWVIRDYGRGLSLSHFIQSGNVEKLFYKDALTPSRITLVVAIAILTIQEVDLVIFSKHGTFTFEIEHSKDQESRGNLKIKCTEPFDLDFKGTLIELNGVEEAFIWKARGTFLQFSKDTVVDHTTWGQIIKNPDKMGGVFVNGVKIAETPHYYYKYNITQVPEPLQNEINSNFSHISKDLYEGVIKKILLTSQSFVIAEEVLLIHGNEEKEQSYQDISWNDITIHFIKVLNQKGEFVFISKLDYPYQHRYNYLSEVEEMKTIYVQDHIIRNLSGLLDYKKTPIFLKDDLIKKNKSRTFVIISYKELDQDEKKIYSNLKRLFELFGGVPKVVKKIRIFELDNFNIETTEGKVLMGQWDKKTNTILVNRLALCSLNEFSRVLFHELIHAKYKCSDMTLDFEDRLSETIGDLAARYIEDFYFDFD